MKKTAALLLALLFCLSLAACGKKAVVITDIAPTPAPAVTAEETPYSPSLPAAKLGNYTVTCGDVENEYGYFMQYVQMYGMQAPEDPAETLEMIVDSAIAEYATAWEADNEGLTLTEEEKAAIENEVTSEKNEIIASYAEDAATMLGADASADQITAKAIELADADALEYVGVDFSSYLDLYRTDLTRAALETGLRAKSDASVTVTDEEVKAYYDQVLADDKAAVAENPEAFRTMYEDYASGVSGVPALCAPEGFKLVQVLPVTMSAEDKETYTAGLQEMTALETEYGHIALAVMTGIDIARMQDIDDRYHELKAETDALYAALAEKAEAVYTRATTENIVFEALMQENGVTGDEKGSLLNTTGDAGFPEEVVKAAAGMQDGEITEIIGTDTCYIVRVVSSVPAGDAAFEDVKDALKAGAVADKQETEWQTLLTEWQTAAGLAAEKFPENYSRIEL